MSPVAILYITAIGAIAAAGLASGDRANRAIGAALLISLASAQLSTYLETFAPLAFGMAICAVTVIQGRTVACVVMAALYAARLLLLSLAFLGVLSVQAFWNWNEVPLVLQILIAYANVLAPPVARSAYKRGYDVRHLRNYISFMNRAL